MRLQGSHILIGVTGGIAAYKVCDLVQRLKDEGAEVRCLLTASAARIISPETLAALTGHPVPTDPWSEAAQGRMTHIEAARWADHFVVAPATAHSLAELSLGLTGSLVSLTALAFDGPLWIAPAMNTVMWNKIPVREAVAKLESQGHLVFPVEGGTLACGEVGEGKLLEIPALVDFMVAARERGRVWPALRGKKVLISLGHTEEPLDAVRFLSNRSSGKTGLALARAFRLQGAEVSLVAGQAVGAPAGFKVTSVSTSNELRDAMLSQAPEADGVVMCAAVADFVPVTTSAGKWKGSRELRSVELRPFPNVLAELGAAKKPGQWLVGFALETEGAREEAARKMEERHCDFMVVNQPTLTPDGGFGKHRVRAAILKAGTPPASAPDASLSEWDKEALAYALVAAIGESLESGRPSA